MAEDRYQLPPVVPLTWRHHPMKTECCAKKYILELSPQIKLAKTFIAITLSKPYLESSSNKNEVLTALFVFSVIITLIAEITCIRCGLLRNIMT